MKRFLLIILIPLAFSCTKTKTKSDPIPLDNSPKMSCRINAVQWAGPASWTVSGATNTLTATGSGKTITLIWDGATTGVFTVNGTSITAVVVDASVPYGATTGTITITKNDPATNKLSGQFNFIVKDQWGGSVFNATSGNFADVVKK